MNARWLGRLLNRVRAGDRHSAWNHTGLCGVPEVIALRSDWFEDGKPMPLRSAGIGVGDNISPPLDWNGVPDGTIELALILEDPDAPLPRPFLHLIAYGIPRDLKRLPEGAWRGRARSALRQEHDWRPRIHGTAPDTCSRPAPLRVPDSRAKSSDGIWVSAES